MPSDTPRGNAAQKQHYVQQAILRNFLGNPEKEQVHVFSKMTGKGFTTSIRNIMAERRFHEFRIDENYIANFEDGISRLEDQLLPTYRGVVEKRKLDRSPEEKAGLATLMAFQFVRTRSARDQFADLEKQLADHLKKWGADIEQIEGYEPLTEDRLVEQHIRWIQDSVLKFASIIAQLDFWLLEASPGRAFYLSDNPVSIHNSQPTNGPYGNIGLGCKGIEVYLPLSSDLMLCAWCPSLLDDMNAKRAGGRRTLAKFTLSPAMAQGLKNAEGQEHLAKLRASLAVLDTTLENIGNGEPVIAKPDNMDFENSLQVGQARDFVICKTADFDLAKKFVKDFPDQRGRRIATDWNPSQDIASTKR